MESQVSGTMIGRSGLQESGRGIFFPWVFSLVVPLIAAVPAAGKESEAAARFRTHIQPMLVEYCFDCHGDGRKKGQVAFDEFEAPDDLVKRKELWLAVLKNVRAKVMPPEQKPRPSAEEVEQLASWIKQDVFGIDPKNPDPGRITLRRLNRVEYRNTIRDLTGYDFNVEEELPPDDTGYGFDNIGDVLTLSPLLLEKYMQAAETITSAAIPRVGRVVREEVLSGWQFREKGNKTAERLSFYEPADVSHSFKVPHAGKYRLKLEFQVAGQFDFDPGRCRVLFEVDGKERLREEFGWHNGKRFQFEFEEEWETGTRDLRLKLEPLTPEEEKKNSLDLRLLSVRVQGPMAQEYWVRPKGFEYFFWKDVPEGADERREYAREVLARFVKRAYRRPVDEGTIERLVEIADDFYSQPGKRFEDGIAQAIIPVLVSPRFLFRVEDIEVPTEPGVNPLVDEYALASRLSYFLWSSMPDDELFALADRGELRKNLSQQVERMLADKKAEAFIDNFTGQWLQVRDVDGIDINARIVLARDAGEERELERRRRDFLARLREREREEREARAAQTNRVAQPDQERANRERSDEPDRPERAERPSRQEQPQERAERPAQEQARERRERERPQRRFFRPTVELDRELRRAMTQETELLMAHIVKDDRPVIELIDSDYTFLNERLARHYGLTNLNVTGSEMRKVSLPPDSPRGGVLTHGSVLIVTSNPTRTSPVKRGLFVLDNILGMPPPPPPPDLPTLEESEKAFKDREPTLREVLELHRSNALCSSCHSRMDPLGLALENFNALGMWREQERNQTIDASGKLITGETFQDVRELKRILAQNHRLDFYRCLTEKVLIYALGRGLDYYDVEAVDRIVERLAEGEGRFSDLLLGVIESVPFQRRRNLDATEPPQVSQASSSSEQTAIVNQQP